MCAGCGGAEYTFLKAAVLSEVFKLRRMQITRKIAHAMGMRISAAVCVINLVILGICGGVYAFSGFNLLYYLCFCNTTAVRAVLGVCFVSALFTLYSLIAFRPFRGLK